MAIHNGGTAGQGAGVVVDAGSADPRTVAPPFGGSQVYPKGYFLALSSVRRTLDRRPDGGHPKGGDPALRGR